MARSMGQPFVAAQIVELGLAIELVQIRTLHNIGRKTGRGGRGGGHGGGDAERDAGRF